MNTERMCSVVIIGRGVRDWSRCTSALINYDLGATVWGSALNALELITPLNVVGVRNVGPNYQLYVWAVSLSRPNRIDSERLCFRYGIGT